MSHSYGLKTYALHWECAEMLRILCILSGNDHSAHRQALCVLPVAQSAETLKYWMPSPGAGVGSGEPVLVKMWEG